LSMPKIVEHRGHIVKTTGDGMLVEFASAVDAARCAVEIQRAMAEKNTNAPQDDRISFASGIHVGDIIIDDNDNLWRRRQYCGSPRRDRGARWCLHFDDAHRQVRGKIDIPFEDIGSQTLKNIAEPMRVWRMRIAGETAICSPRSLPLLDRLNPARFTASHLSPCCRSRDMSGDPEQEYFADGIAEDVLTTLSKVPRADGHRSLFELRI